jgi:hypothetical protein
MKPTPADPNLIRKHGDSVERQLADKILNTIPSYATFWATFIGNDGTQNYLPMAGADPSVHESRVKLWEQLYTLFESLALCWELEHQLADREKIVDNADYMCNLNAWTAFYAHLGRIHDTAERVTQQLNERRLFQCFDPFYEKRHIALHGIKVPMRWADNVLCAPPLGEEAGHWHTKMGWDELGKADFDFISSTVARTLRELEIQVEFFFSQVLQLAPSRLGLCPVQWPDPDKNDLRASVATVSFAGTQCSPSGSGIINVSVQ